MSTHPSDLSTFRRVSMVLGTLLFSCGIAPQAHAADHAQRVAMACTHAGQVGGCKPMSLEGHPSAQALRAAKNVAPVKPHKAMPGTAAINYERDLWRHQSAS